MEDKRLATHWHGPPAKIQVIDRFLVPGGMTGEALIAVRMRSVARDNSGAVLVSVMPLGVVGSGTAGGSVGAVASVT